MIDGFKYLLFIFVAPYAGAWIEIVIAPRFESFHASLPTRERGLKSFAEVSTDKFGRSLPTRERGLKFLPNLSLPNSNRRSLRGSVD